MYLSVFLLQCYMYVSLFSLATWMRMAILYSLQEWIWQRPEKFKEMVVYYHTHPSYHHHHHHHHFRCLCSQAMDTETWCLGFSSLCPASRASVYTSINCIYMYHRIKRYPCNVTMKMMSNYYTKAKLQYHYSEASQSKWKWRESEDRKWILKLWLKFTFIFRICSMSKQIQ